jgi:predicted nucleic acid-binding protein
MTPVHVDTNVILRFLTREPPDMAQQALALFTEVQSGEINLFLEEIVLAEVVWVLRSFYHYSPIEVSDVLQEFVNFPGIACEHKTTILIALRLFAVKNLDFADAMVAAHMIRKGIDSIYSFDTHFDRLPGITRLIPGQSSA